MYDTIMFNNTNILSLDGITLFNHDFNKLPSRDIKINKIARRDKSIITSSEYSQKNITILLKVNKKCRQNTEIAITNLKAVLQAQNAQLSTWQGDANISYTATLNEFNIEWMAATAIVTLVFIASDPIGQNGISHTLIDTTITSPIVNLSVQVAGSATATPIFVLTVNTVTGGTAKSISILNSSTYQGITITRDWIANDVLIVDSDDLSVTVNDNVVDFTGMFPQFPAGAQQITYVDDFTTRDVDLVATYYPRLV